MDSDDPSETYAAVIEALGDENPDQYLEYLDRVFRIQSRSDAG
jgi:hypothetical protein